MYKLFSNSALALYFAVTWVGLIGFIIADSRGTFGTDIGFSETLRTSSLARGMFADIGALSTIVAAWIAFGTKLRVRWLFALVTLFVGSFAVLPYLAIYLWTKRSAASVLLANYRAPSKFRTPA